MIDRETNTLTGHGLEELRVNLGLKEKFTCELHNTSSKFNIRVQILLVIYVLICIMFSSLVKRVLLYKLFYELYFSNNS